MEFHLDNDSTPWVSKEFFPIVVKVTQFLGVSPLNIGVERLGAYSCGIVSGACEFEWASSLQFLTTVLSSRLLAVLLLGSPLFADGPSRLILPGQDGWSSGQVAEPSRRVDQPYCPALAVFAGPKHTTLKVGTQVYFSEKHPPAYVLEMPFTGTDADYERFKHQLFLILSTLNAENLGFSVGRYLPDPKTGKRTLSIDPKHLPGPKPEWAIRGIQEWIERAGPDIMGMQEVELTDLGFGYFANSAVEFTQTRVPHLVPFSGPTNDGRLITIATLVKKANPFDYRFESHLNEPMPKNDLYPDRKLVYSRDLTALIVYIRNQPPLIFLVKHGKSMRTDSERDPNSKFIQTQEVLRDVSIIKDYESGYPGARIFLVGDSNIAINLNPDHLQPYFQAGLVDLLSATPGAYPLGDLHRGTQTYHPLDAHHVEQPRVVSQLDMTFANGAGAAILHSAQVQGFLGADAEELPLPQTFAERKTRPTDHRGIRVILQNPMYGR